MRVAALLVLAAVSCKTTDASHDAGTAQASPQASAEPAPLATPLALSANASPEGGPPPVPMRGDLPLPPETPLPKDPPGYTVAIVLRLPDAPAVTVGSPVNASAIDAIRKQNEPRFEVDLTSSRMRMRLVSPGFLLPRDAEIRARDDRYGHVFLMPDLASYRVLAPGTLRSLFGERRVDVSPLSPAEVSEVGDGPVRLGYHTRRAEVQSRAGKGEIEIAKVPELGEGGALLVRAILDLMNAPPQVSVVGTDELPVHAELHWSTRGALFFEVTSITKRAEIPWQSIAVPPAGAGFTTGPLAPMAGELRVDEKQLAALHGGPMDLGPSAARVTSGPLVLVNAANTPRLAWIDGAPVAWIGDGARLELPSLPRGRYQVEWRSFLDDAGEPARSLTVPPIAQPVDAGVH